MSQQVKIDNFVNKFSQKEIDQFKNTFVIVPYQHSGQENYTNSGIKEGVRDPNDFETFKQIWTGNDACVLNWKGSVTCNQNPTTKKLEIEYHLGEVILGELEMDTKDIVVQDDKSFSDYKSQETQISVTMRISNHFDLHEGYDFMFFKIPELYGSTLFRIESVNKNYMYDKLLGYVITFRSVNQTYSNSGKARQQNIMPNAPGQGYLECEVKPEKWLETLGEEEKNKLIPNRDYYALPNGKYITANYQKTMNRPVKKCIVKLLGAGILSSVCFVGRRINEGNSFKDYGEPEMIFPINFTPPTTPTLFRAQSEIQNFYFGSFSPKVLYIKEFMSNVKDMNAPLNKWNNQGVLGIEKSKLKETNPQDDGHYKHSIYGNTFNTETGDIVRDPWKFELTTKDIKGLASYGCESYYTIGGNKIIHDHMWDNYWTQKDMKTLPMSTQSSLGFGWNTSSAIGAAITRNFWFGAVLGLVGISGGLIQWATTPKFKSFRGLISADLIELNDQYSYGNAGGAIAFNILQSQSKNNPSSIFFDGSTMMTGIEADLTNKFYSTRYGKEFRTGNIGQTVDEQGNNLIPSGDTLLLNGQERLVSMEELDFQGFIIDKIMIQACFDGDISIEFKDNNGEVCWSGVYQSEGKWTGSLREIWTIKNTSVFNRENLFFTEPIPYPKELPIPLGENIKTPEINLSYTIQDFQFINPYEKFPDKYWDKFVGRNLKGSTNHIGQAGTPIDIDTVSIYDVQQSIDTKTIYKQKLWDFTDLINNYDKFKKYYPKIELWGNSKNYFSLGIRGSSTSYYNKIEVASQFNKESVNIENIELNNWYEWNGKHEENNEQKWSRGEADYSCTANNIIKKIKYRIIQEGNSLFFEVQLVEFFNEDRPVLYYSHRESGFFYYEEGYFPYNEILKINNSFSIKLIPRF